VLADSAEDIVLTCMPGLRRVAPAHYELSLTGLVLTCMLGIRRVAPTRYELSRSDFHPEQELELLILQPNKKN